MQAVSHTGRTWPAVSAWTPIQGVEQQGVWRRGGQQANQRGWVSDPTNEPSPARGESGQLLA
jgi:hypothetical protein